MLSSAIHALLSVPSNLKQWKRIYDGSRHYRRTGETPERAYQSLIKLYCRTNGHANDFMHAIVAKQHPPRPITDVRGILGQPGQTGIRKIVDTIGRDGFFVMPDALPNDVCDRLATFAEEHEAALYPPPSDDLTHAVYDPNSPVSAGYWFEEQTIVHSPDVQALMADTTILRVAQDYLCCEPIMDIVGMWWSVAAAKRTSEAERHTLAQLYHFDMNRIKWLKVLFYLTDVDKDGGPHCFIKGTHKAGSQPEDVLKNGYQRVTDEELARHYQTEDMIEITGRRGTVVIADTRGFHKGKTPISRDRLVFQLNFCSSLFGASIERSRLPHRLQSSPEDFGARPSAHLPALSNPRMTHGTFHATTGVQVAPTNAWRLSASSA